ncbi:MAG: hypothetical protein JWO98_60 [Frankiales bacterium]|nr:hypothetical protein [Frankiales bacterium]
MSATTTAVTPAPSIPADAPLPRRTRPGSQYWDVSEACWRRVPEPAPGRWDR